MTKNYLLSCLLLFFCVSGFTQVKNQVAQDSLEKLYEVTKKAIRDYEFLNSLEHALSLIELASEGENETYLYHGYNLLGVTYASMEDRARAKDNYLKALDHAIASKNDTILWWAYNNLGNVFSQNEATKEKGFHYYKKAIEIVNRIKDFENGIDPIMNTGWTYLDHGELDKAYPYLIRSRELLGPEAKNFKRAYLAALFGMYYSGKGNYEKSRSYFEKSVQIAEKDSLIIEATMAYEEYANMLFKSGAYKEAYKALHKHLDYQNEIFEQEKLRQMEVAYSRFETAEYRKDLALAEKQQEYKDEVIVKSKQISILLVCSSSVLLLFLIMLFKNNRIRKKLILQLKEKNRQLRISKDKAEQLSLSKTRFFSTVSHELRTPLYGVVGLTSLLLEDNKNKNQEEDLKSLKFSADYLLALINDVLQMNKIESNLLQLENMKFNIDALMTGIVNSFQFSKHQNNNNIELEIDKEIPHFLIGDSVRLSQVLMNLMGNALKFTERGNVWMKAERRTCEEKYCRIYFEVGDTGMGIPEAKHKEIFDEFSQLRTTNYNYQGTGLGLPIVKKLLFLFDSEIHLQSEIGKGSVFSFEIVFEIAEGALENLSTTGPAEELPEANHKTILIVDDNRINQIVTQRILEKQNFECKVAGSGEEALEIIKSQDLDLVLMDVNMPGMNGMQTTMKIREMNKVLPVIALTAVEIEEMREEILASGMNDIIVKPYDIPQFLQTILRNLAVPVES